MIVAGFLIGVVFGVVVAVFYGVSDGFKVNKAVCCIVVVLFGVIVVVALLFGY